MALNKLELTIAIDAPLEKVWDELVDWESQGKWMLQTTVWTKNAGSTPADVEIFAFTGPLHFLYPRFKFLGLLDHMKITEWQPPHRCDVVHIGKVLKGTGTFQLTEKSPNSTIFYWSESVIAPQLLFAVIRPFFTVGVWISLRSLARLLKSKYGSRAGE